MKSILLLLILLAGCAKEPDFRVEYTPEQKCRAGVYSLFSPPPPKDLADKAISPCIQWWGPKYGFREGEREPLWRTLHRTSYQIDIPSRISESNVTSGKMLQMAIQRYDYRSQKEPKP